MYHTLQMVRMCTSTVASLNDYSTESLRLHYLALLSSQTPLPHAKMN